MSPQADHAAEQSHWGRDALAAALDSAAEHAHDVAWGDGHRYRVGNDPAQTSQLEVFPASGVVRLTDGEAQITLFRQPPPSIYRDRVRFEQSSADRQLELTLTRRGQLRLDIRSITPDVPATDIPEPVARPERRAGNAASLPQSFDTPATQPAQPVETGPIHAGHDARGMDVPSDTETAVLRDSGRPEGPVDEPSGTFATNATAGDASDHMTDPGTARVAEVVEAETTTKRPRLTLAGRLGREPSFRTTRTGTLVASFPLAVRDDAGETTWHTVLAFGERAERLREGLAKGQQVEVIGYLHQRDRATRTGEPRTIEEIYATVVTAR